MSDTLKAAIEELRGEVEVLADEIRNDSRISNLRKKITVLNALEDHESQPKTVLGDLLDFGTTPSSASSGVVSVEPDEFYGKDSLDAAKLYLKKRGKPAKLEEIMDGIRRGGGNPGSERELRTKLTRSTYQIAKVGGDFFGLVEFYDNLKRGRKKKNGAKDDAEESPETVDTPGPEPTGDSSSEIIE